MSDSHCPILEMLSHLRINNKYSLLVSKTDCENFPDLYNIPRIIQATKLTEAYK